MGDPSVLSGSGLLVVAFVVVTLSGAGCEGSATSSRLECGSAFFVASS